MVRISTFNYPHVKFSNLRSVYMNGTFGERLSVLIKKRGIKKKELAERLKLDVL